MISVCMIVKDEIKFIEDCITKIKPFVDEIVVVDTGSTDGTKEIATKLGCRVYDFEWCNDFSKARNYSISKASNDWILIIDADEHTLEFDMEFVNKFVNNKSNVKKIGKIAVKSYFGEGISNHKVHNLSRLFNKNYYAFELPIHEALYPITKITSLPMYIDIPISVAHYGYIDSVSIDKNKNDRNQKLLEEHLKTNFNGFLVQQLAVCYQNTGRFDDAIDLIDTIIDKPEIQAELYFPEVVQVKLSALISKEKYDEAIKLQDYFELCKDDDLYLMKMVNVFRKTNNNETALDICQYLISKKDLQISRLEPVYQIAEILFEHELYEEAINWYKKIEIVQGVSEKIKLCEQKLGL